MSKAKTMKELYTEILEQYGLTDEHKEFVQGRIDQIDKKSASRSAKPNAENEQYKADILTAMVENTGYRAMDIVKLCGLSTTQKATALLGQLVESKQVSKGSVKGVTYYTKVSE